MIRGAFRGYALISSLGFAAGLAGCSVVIGEGDGGDAVCIVDYDECLDLGVDEGICQAIYESCAGDDGGGSDGGDDGGGGCWDEVQQCLEDNDGDEAQCQDIIEACQGGDDGDGEGDGGDDGQTCWDEVEQCYEANPDSDECEALAQMCLGGDDGMPDDGGDGEPMGCEEILEQCADPDGNISDDCWWEYEQCVGGGDDGEPPCMDPDDPQCCADGACGCEEQYNQCVDSGQDPTQCEEEYQWCIGMPTDDGGDDGNPYFEQCDELANHCEQTQASEVGYCEPIWNACQPGEADECFYEFFDCVQLEFGDTMSLWDVDEMTSFSCYESLSSCVQF